MAQRVAGDGIGFPAAVDRGLRFEPGKLADLVILSRDPTAIDPENLDQLEVVETIKEGVTVFRSGHAAAPEARANR